MSSCPHHTPMSAEALDNLRTAIKQHMKTIGIASIPSVPLVEIKHIKDHPTAGYSVSCCGFDNPANKVEELRVENKKSLRVSAVCECCQRRVIKSIAI